MSDRRYSRQVLIFGEPGQKKIEAQRVGVVGLGGLGSQVVQSLAYLGVRRFCLVDNDCIEETNLNRVVGACRKDIDRLKVDVARDLILGINAEAEVVALPENLRTRIALELLIGCSVIFGCVDHDGPRLGMTDLAAAYEITLIDLATEVFPENQGQPFDFGGRVVVARPGDYCLFCADQLDRELAKQDLETPEVHAERQRHGYGLGADTPAPAVIALNGVIANLGVMEFLAMTTGTRQPARRLTYLGLRGAVRDTADKGKLDYFTCYCLRGQREQANIWRYVLPDEGSKPFAAE
jgi:hypothetical protein